MSDGVSVSSLSCMVLGRLLAVPGSFFAVYFDFDRAGAKQI